MWMDTAQFERDRLALFARNGFDAASRWLVDTSGKKTYAMIRDGHGPTTLVIHGGLAEAGVWYAMAGRLAERLTGKIVVPDRPGHGLTHGIDYTGVDYRKAAVEWMLHLVDSLGERQVDLVGNSMGGYFCLVFALAHPERVRRLAIVAAPAGVDRPLPLFLRLWGRPVIGNVISAMMGGMKDPEELRTKVLASMVARPERIATDALEVLFRAGARPDWHPMARSMVRAVSDLGGWRPELDIREEVARLAVPTVFAWGDKDNFAPPASGEDLARRMPNARFELLENAGHLPQLDAPEECAAVVGRFFTEEAPRASTGASIDDRRAAAVA
jgi:2-hydroxy-6-oxonona-2,4-dienedioate hydrolase